MRAALAALNLVVGLGLGLCAFAAIGAVDRTVGLALRELGAARATCLRAVTRLPCVRLTLIHV